MSESINRLFHFWNELYGNQKTDLLEQFVADLKTLTERSSIEPLPAEWYKDVIVYSLYVDLFNVNFQGLQEKLDYLENLGINCLWLLPVLDSPMRDAGFDIRNYTSIRSDLVGLPETSTERERLEIFRGFIQEAHRRGIHVIFDIAMNHTSDEHPWFIAASRDEQSPYRDYYIWTKDTSLYKDARIIFEGIETSNWEKVGEWYYFHRFFSFQPDLNYRNPAVLIEMSRILVYWLQIGIDGFRVDAIPYLWKEDGTDCENLPQTHTIVKFFRAVTDMVRPNTLLLAEACQKPFQVVKYFGNGDECHAGYHFPLMPQIYKTLALKSREPIRHVLSREVTPEIPDISQWFTFLRCHDELSLELVYVTEEDRKFIHSHYCRDPLWDFRKGQGISARLADLLEYQPEKIALAFSVMLTLPGTPVIYYGDEFGKTNDPEFYYEKTKETGKNDTRFLVRGKIDWNWLANELRNTNSFHFKVFREVSTMIRLRKQLAALGRGTMEWVEVLNPAGFSCNTVMAWYRTWRDEKLLIIHNLLEESVICRIVGDIDIPQGDLFGKKIEILPENNSIVLDPYAYHWIRL